MSTSQRPSLRKSTACLMPSAAAAAEAVSPASPPPHCNKTNWAEYFSVLQQDQLD